MKGCGASFAKMLKRLPAQAEFEPGLLAQLARA